MYVIYQPLVTILVCQYVRSYLYITFDRVSRKCVSRKSVCPSDLIKKCCFDGGVVDLTVDIGYRYPVFEGCDIFIRLVIYLSS